MDIVVYVKEQRMSISDYTNPHAHLDLPCSHMGKGHFSHVVHQMIVGVIDN